MGNKKDLLIDRVGRRPNSKACEGPTKVLHHPSFTSNGVPPKMLSTCFLRAFYVHFSENSGMSNGTIDLEKEDEVEE